MISRQFRGQYDKSLVVRLKGGLGNQLFQYAFGRAAAVSNGFNLRFDTFSGFWRDKEFQRKLRLSFLSSEMIAANLFDSVPFFLNDIYRRAPKLSFIVRETDKFARVVENETQYSDPNWVPGVSYWADGFWQSPNYFVGQTELIKTEVSPPAPLESLLRDLGDQIAEETSVCVGFRVYEETRNPTVHFSNGQVVSLEAVKRATARLISETGATSLYVFSTVSDSELGPSSSWALRPRYFTPFNLEASDLETLWLFSRGQGHVITPSSFYWWGAFLSDYQSSHPHRTLAASNFLNRDSYVPGWRTFE